LVRFDRIGNGLQFYGGGIFNDGVMTLSGSTVSGNYSGNYGIYDRDGIFNDNKGHLKIEFQSSVDYLFDLGSLQISSDSYVGVIRK
jgi:hypothetical protein